WHLGLGGEDGPQWNADLTPGPLDIGFDYAFLMPATGDRVPCVYVENRRVVGLDPADPITVNYKQKVGEWPTGKENPDLLTLKPTHGHDMTIVKGVSRIGWMTGGKAALWTDEEMADTFAKQAIKFIESQREQPFFLYFASHGIHVPRVPHPRFRGKSPVGTRGDAILELDDTVGQLLAALDRLKLAQNTLVIFTSDNGGVMDDGYEDVGKFDYHPNAPLRGTKGTLFEGGHRVPFIARWPAKIPAASTSSGLIAHLDFTATFAALAGAKVPAGGARDSIDVGSVLVGPTDSPSPRKTFVAHVGGAKTPQTIRHGEWKYIEPGRAAYGKAAAPKGAKPDAAKGQLYNLTTDPSEEKNLIDAHPERAQELIAKLRSERGE
ncbi:MAG TPA: sulfatase-like hydrolase/transferase, partial [Pirellulaceae bacterium]|nr:sulfatase-like hydrolase/transferase [Pirellulaceae bacterium]